MRDLLKGNYELEKDKPQATQSTDDPVVGIFEKKASERLGGSIAYVMKGKRLLWDEADE